MADRWGAGRSGAGCRRAIRGVLFDKDGTLFDFQATWARWAVALLEELAQGDPALRARLARRIGFDLGQARFRPESPVIAGTPEEAARCLGAELPGWSIAALRDRIDAVAAAVELAPAADLAALTSRLRAAGMVLGVATNDAEAVARAHLRRAGVERQFAFVAGSDSGHGAKPAPGMCLAFARAAGLAPGAVAMVGDSAHDLHAAGAAGMIRVAVLTGVAGAADLAPLADVVLPDVGHLPAWLGLAE